MRDKAAREKRKVVRATIGRQLRAQYEMTLALPLSDRLSALLREIEQSTDERPS